MKILILIISTLLIIITAYNLFFDKKTVEKQQDFLKDKNDKTEQVKEKFPYISKGDISGQIIYENTKNKVLNFLKTQLKNKIELSWQFLYDITNIIIKKFNDEDKNMINQIGHNLLKNGMKYEHVINFGINLGKLKSVASNKSKNNNIDIS